MKFLFLHIIQLKDSLYLCLGTIRLAYRLSQPKQALSYTPHTINNMKKSFSTIWLAVAATLTFSLPSCSDNDHQTDAEEITRPAAAIVNRTECSGFWRYDFTYGTVDADGKTPITLSAAIFMTPDVHDKHVQAKGCGLLNHYTITADNQRPTNVTSGLTLEGVLANTNYIMIESDGFGFGIDAPHSQRYLQGRAAARVNIDAFLAGRQLLKEEGFEFGDVTLNLGYSQGGHSGMWVNRLVAEGYRSDELPKIDYCIIGGGSYDMYSHYRYLAAENLSQYPVALPLILSGMIDAGGYKVKNEDIFDDGFVPYLTELFDTKQHDTDYINSFIYDHYGTTKDQGLPIDQLVKQAFFDETNEPMKDIVYHLKQNSLVYDAWVPNKTDRITFVHARTDEVVPFLNQEKMAVFLLANGYTAFDIDDSSKNLHTNTGFYYVLKATACLSAFVPAGMKNAWNTAPQVSTYDIYRPDGRLACKQTTLIDAYRMLPPGVYVINGKTMVKE